MGRARIAMQVEIPEEVEQDFRLFVVLHGGKILNKNADLRGNGNRHKSKNTNKE